MPRKSVRRAKKKAVRTPGGRRVIHVIKKKPGTARCAGCGALLHGVRNERKASKSENRVNRPYGGNLCSSCMRIKKMEEFLKTFEKG